MYVFISCVKSKKNKPSKASELYTSTLFKYSLRYALSLTKRDKIFILSAKYGLVKLDDIIQPYELSLKNMNKRQRKEWAYKVYKQLVREGIDFNEEAIFLCGKKYREFLITKFTNAKAPLKDLRFGKQLEFYKEALNEENKQ